MSSASQIMWQKARLSIYLQLLDEAIYASKQNSIY